MVVEIARLDYSAFRISRRIFIREETRREYGDRPGLRLDWPGVVCTSGGDQMRSAGVSLMTSAKLQSTNTEL